MFRLDRIGKTYQPQHLDHGRTALRLPEGAAVQRQCFANLVAYGVQGRQGGHGFLEDDGNAAAADGLHFPTQHVQARNVHRRARTVRVVEKDFTLLDTRHAGQDAHHRLGHDRFARSGLTHQRHRAPGRNAKRNAIHCLDRARIDVEVDLQILDRENVWHVQ